MGLEAPDVSTPSPVADGPSSPPERQQRLASPVKRR